MSSPLSGFTAVPNPQMLAFMPIQSYLMMYFAGSAWQFGKRKISAKSNEEFNNLTMKTLLEEHTMELKSVIPTLERSLQDVTPLIRILIEQYGDFIKEALQVIPVVAKDVLFQGQGIFSPEQEGNKQALKDIKDWIDRNFPNAPTAYAEELVETLSGGVTNRGFTTGGSAAIDTSGQSLEEFNRLKAERQAKLVADRANRPRIVASFNKAFGKPIVPQVARTIEKRKAGQSAIMERNRLIKSIASIGRALTASSLSKASIRQRIQRTMVPLLKQEQQKLTNLLARYRF